MILISKTSIAIFKIRSSRPDPRATTLIIAGFT